MAGTVSIIIPTRGSQASIRGVGVCMVAQLLAALPESSGNLDPQYVVVVDDDVDDDYLDPARAALGSRLAVVPFTPPFNFSAKINLGVAHADGEIVVLLNDDVEPISPNWLDRLVTLAQRPEVGAVGARLRYEDGTIQHAGIQFEREAVYNISSGIALADAPLADFLDREVHAVTGACLAQRRSVWEALGGWDEALPNNFNDVEYCHRITSSGLAVVQANSVELYHFESRTRQPQVSAAEVARVMSVLAAALEGGDPGEHFGRREGDGRVLGLLMRNSLARSVRYEGWRATWDKARSRQ